MSVIGYVIAKKMVLKAFKKCFSSCVSLQGFRYWNGIISAEQLVVCNFPLYRMGKQIYSLSEPLQISKYSGNFQQNSLSLWLY